MVRISVRVTVHADRYYILMYLIRTTTPVKLAEILLECTQFGSRLGDLYLQKFYWKTLGSNVDREMLTDVLFESNLFDSGP